MIEDDLPKLPPLEKLLRGIQPEPEEVSALSKTELLRQLSEHVPAEEVRKLSEDTDRIVCPLLEVIDGIGEVEVTRGVFPWSPNVGCKYFFKANPIQMQKGSCTQMIYKPCAIAKFYRPK